MRSRSSRREANAHEAHLLPPPCVDGYQKERKALCALSSLLRVHGSDAVCHCVPRRHPRALYGQWQGERLRHLCGRDDDELGSFVVSVFIALFLFYTNSFLLRRRKKEFGLYSVLGMDRGALSAILFWETLLAAAFTLIAGLGLGLLLSYVSQSALLRLLSLPAAAFTVSLAAIKQCAITFHRHLRAALRARCAVAAPCTGRGAF